MGERETKLTRGLGSLSQHLIQQWLQVLGIRITCVCKLCTPPALKHDTHQYRHSNAQLPTPFPSFPFTLRGGLTQRGGSYDGFFLAWALGNIKWQCARAARVPISGPSHPTVRSSSLCHRCPQLIASATSTYLMRWLPCANHGHVGTSPISTVKPFVFAHGSSVNNLLAPSLQFDSLSTYSNQARAPSAASSRWMVAAPASNIGCPLEPFTDPDKTAELSSNHKRDLPLMTFRNLMIPRTRAACSTRAMQCSESPHAFMSLSGITAAIATYLLGFAGVEEQSCYRRWRCLVLTPVGCDDQWGHRVSVQEDLSRSDYFHGV